MAVPLEALSTKPVTLSGVFTGVTHIVSFLSDFGKKRGILPTPSGKNTPEKSKKAGLPPLPCVAVLFECKRSI